MKMTMLTLEAHSKTAKDIDHSPFLPHHASHQPRLMEGVRRWMGGQPHSNRRRSKNKSRRRPDAKETENTISSLDPHCTEYIVGQLMDPMVPESEIAEYQGYVGSNLLYLLHPF